MCGKISAFFFIGLIAFLSNSVTQVESGAITVGIPPEAVKYAIGKIDSWLSCSRFDGYAQCWARDAGKQKRDRVAKDCKKGNIWDYTQTFGFKCWCIKCY